MGLGALVGHRDEVHPRLPPLAESRRDRRERIAGIEHLGAHQVRGDVAIAQPEPRWLEPVVGQLLFDGEGLRFAPPAALLGDAVAEGVHHGVEVRAHAQPVNPDVVTGVADDGDLRVRSCGQQAAQEARSSDAAGEHGDAAQR